VPLYEYTCPHCGYRGEIILPVEHEKPKCPKCGTVMKKELTTAAIQMR
jgi:putative FmdB family regulatory protein